MVQTQHGGEVGAGQIGRALHGDIGVGVRRVADHQHLDVAAGHGVQGLALGREYLAVDGQQFGALHAGATGTRADQQGVIDIFERRHGVAVRLHPGQQGECAIFKLHHHALQGLLGFFDWHFEQTQHHRLVFAQHFARRNTKQDGITDLTGSTGYCHANRLFKHENS